MKKIIYLLIFATILCISSINIYATESSTEWPTDPFSGEPIDWWDPTGYGGEDNAGLEDMNETTESTEAATYSFDELVEIEMQRQEVQETAETVSEYGDLRIRFTDSEDLEGNRNNIRVVVWRDGNNKEEIYLYRQNDYYAAEQVPVGSYTFDKAVTIDGEYQFSSDINSFDIEFRRVVTLTLTLGWEPPTREQDIVETTTEAITEPETVIETTAEVVEEEGFPIIWYVIAGMFLFMALLFLGLVIHKFRLEKKYKDGDY